MTKAGEEDRSTNGCGGAIILKGVIREDLTDKGYLERPREDERVSHAKN